MGVLAILAKPRQGRQNLSLFPRWPTENTSALTVLCGHCKVLPPNHFHKQSHRFFGIRFEILIYELLVVY